MPNSVSLKARQPGLMVSSPSLIPNLIAAGLYIAATLYQGSHLAQGRKADKRLLGLLGERPDTLTVDLSPAQLPAIAKALPIGDPGELLQRQAICTGARAGNCQVSAQGLRLYGACQKAGCCRKQGAAAQCANTECCFHR